MFSRSAAWSGTMPARYRTICRPLLCALSARPASNGWELMPSASTRFHWPAWKGAPESASPSSIEEAVGALAKLKDEGKIRQVGVSNFNVQQMQRAQSVAPITWLQPP
jgi:hypothetical protein